MTSRVMFALRLRASWRHSLRRQRAVAEIRALVFLVDDVAVVARVCGRRVAFGFGVGFGDVGEGAAAAFCYAASAGEGAFAAACFAEAAGEDGALVLAGVHA